MNHIWQTLGGVAVIISILLIDWLVIVEHQTDLTNMVWIEPGSFTMGSDQGMPDERPAHDVSLSGFWLDQYEVTNADYSEFVKATGHETKSEEFGDSLVFTAVNQEDNPDPDLLDWWQLITSADWRHPQGPEDSIDGKMNHPVVQVSYDDALAYCHWLGKNLPSEAQYEYAARGGREGELYSWGDQPLHLAGTVANNWQGTFPFENENVDRFAGTAPVGSFPANDYGLHDITGNVWEWVSDWYHPRYYEMSPNSNPAGVKRDESLDPAEPGLAKRSIRGGSFLCSDNYCSGFRVSARMPADPQSSTNHTGFRCAADRGRPPGN